MTAPSIEERIEGLSIKKYSIEELHDVITDASVAQSLLDGALERFEDALEWSPLGHQAVPGVPWSVWLLLGGRGTGKTDAGAHWMDQHAQGPPCDTRLPGGHRMSIVGPTLGDVIESCVFGPSGLRQHNHDVHYTTSGGGSRVVWPNGAEAKLFGGWSVGDAERFRAGGNRCAAWIEEAAAIPQLDAVWEQIPFGHRLGRHPQVFLSTTPKPRGLIKRWLAQARTWRELDYSDTARRWERVVVTRGTTDDNPYLDAEVREGLYDLYGGTRLEAQELLGELIEDFEGALWSRDAVEALMVTASDVPNLAVKWVGVDPSMWGIKALMSGAPVPEGEIGRGVETGIVVSGMDAKRHLYTLADYSKRMTPNDWANRAINAAIRYKAGIVPETNAGGPLVVANIMAVEASRRLGGEEMPRIRIYKEGSRYGVHASDGKRARAEPVATLTDQQRHHFVDQGLDLLIDQCCGWDPNEPWSPDRMDAMVWSAYACKPWRGGGKRSVGTSAGVHGAVTRR